MVQLGRYNDLRVVKLHEIGVFLDGGEYGEILMPRRYVPEGTQADDVIPAFVYRDSEDLIIATTLEPAGEVGDIVYLQCTQVNDFGAFMAWGLPKDLLVPYREQSKRMEEGQSYWVLIYLDNASQRITATSKLHKFINNTELHVVEGEEVELCVFDETDLGYKVIVNREHWGLIYRNEVFRPIKTGEILRGFVKKIRSENQLDIALQKQGFEGVQDESKKLMSVLREHKGFLPLNDKSSPEEVYQVLKMSKKTFKKAAGTLYKQQLILIGEKGISIVNDGD